MNRFFIAAFGRFAVLQLGCSFVTAARSSLAAGVLLVSHQGVDEVHKYDAVSGASLGVFASGLNDPSGIGFDSNNGFVYVANYSGNTVHKYSATGADLGVFVSSGLSGPEAVLVDPTGNVYVSNYNNSTLTKYNSSGTLLDTFSLGGNPEGLSFAANGDLLVNYYGGNHVRRFSPAGSDLGTFATTGGNPAGSVTDSFGNLYIAEYSGAALKTFSSSGGAPVDSLAPGYSPWGLAINETGQLLVSDLLGNKIDRYDLSLNYIGLFANTAAYPNYMFIIPEPSRAVLLFFGLAGLLLRRRR